MASLSKDPAGNRTVQFVGPDGKRRSIRLGKVSTKLAEGFKQKVESLVSFTAAKLPLDAETADWLGKIGDELAARLAAVGLVPHRHSRKLGEFLESYIAGRRGNSKPATVITIEQVARDLKGFFGVSKPLRSITEEDAEGYKLHYQKRGLAPATMYRRLKMVKMLLGHAHKLKLTNGNPFADVKAKNANPQERRHYISTVDTEKLMAAARTRRGGRSSLWRDLGACVAHQKFSRFAGSM